MFSSNDTRPFLPFALPSVSEEEIAAVAEAMRSGWLTTGARTAKFETEFAATVGADNALAVNSCTAAMHLGLDALGVGEGDRVALPVWTFTASAEVLRYVGAHPLFVDVDRATLNIDPALLEVALDRAERDGGGPVRAIMPVHFAGQPCDMEAIMAVARARGLRVIEDAAHCFPGKVRMTGPDGGPSERSIGDIGDITAFSFYATKTISTGEGGMITCREPELARRMKVMRLHGISRDVWDRYTSKSASWRYDIVDAGFKYNLTDIASTMGLVQLGRADEFLAARTRVAAAYDTAFADLPEVETPTIASTTSLHSWHLYVMRIVQDRLTIGRDAFISELNARGIGTSVHFIPLHLMTYWSRRYGLSPHDFPVASGEFERVVSLPIYPRMTESDVGRVVDAVVDVVRAHRR
jgi:dTDP-4-amino-4,6-dideoxygalactose transaminase